MSNKKKSFFLFHLNLAFSSIEYAQHEEVIKKCYFPLLKTFSDHNIKLAIELSGWTLERISELSPDWIKLLRTMIQNNQVELVASGYCQLIGPLAPYKINLKNHQIGLEVYKKILNTHPESVLVNEMAFSNGIAEVYQDIGYKNMIMDGDNLSLSMNISKESLFNTKYAVGELKKDLVKLLPTDSILFQKFQRVAHGDLDISEYENYLKNNISLNNKLATAIYCNDAEVFNFRPGRFAEEGSIDQDEWKNIEMILEIVKNLQDHEVLFPKDVCSEFDLSDFNHLLINSLSYPVPVKKQKKYNLARWAVTGRDDSKLNAACYSSYKQFEEDTNIENWKDLIFMWSSDNRTHITSSRWKEKVTKSNIYKKYASFNKSRSSKTKSTLKNSNKNYVNETERVISINTDSFFLQLDKNKGLSIIESGMLINDKKVRLIGTIEHGVFDNIELGADFFTGSLVIQDMQNAMLLTDLQKIKPSINYYKDHIEICANIILFNQKIKKIIFVYFDKPKISIRYELNSIPRTRATLRLSAATIKTENLSESNIVVVSKTGGNLCHDYFIDKEFDHGAPVSHRVSSTSSLPSSNGKISIGVGKYKIIVSWDPGSSFFYPLFMHAKDLKGNLTRLHLSNQEVDDTLIPDGFYGDLEYSINFSHN